MTHLQAKTGTVSQWIPMIWILYPHQKRGQSSKRKPTYPALGIAEWFLQTSLFGRVSHYLNTERWCLTLIKGWHLRTGWRIASCVASVPDPVRQSEQRWGLKHLLFQVVGLLAWPSWVLLFTCQAEGTEVQWPDICRLRFLNGNWGQHRTEFLGIAWWKWLSLTQLALQTHIHRKL